MNELLQHVFARRFIAPFALRKQRSALVIVFTLLAGIPVELVISEIFERP